jgi:serine kinase of HPr protein (carbohydrate metabolism regulator)
MRDAPHFIHASAVMVGEGAVLIRGPSGSGKSRLALNLIDGGAGRGIFTRLIGDDRVGLEVVNGRLLVAPHSAVAGLIEERGTGILSQTIALSGVVRLCVDLEKVTTRLPAEAETSVEIAGIRVPRLTIRADSPPHEAARRVFAAMNWA